MLLILDEIFKSEVNTSVLWNLYLDSNIFATCVFLFSLC